MKWASSSENCDTQDFALFFNPWKAILQSSSDRGIWKRELRGIFIIAFSFGSRKENKGGRILNLASGKDNFVRSFSTVRPRRKSFLTSESPGLIATFLPGYTSRLRRCTIWRQAIQRKLGDFFFWKWRESEKKFFSGSFVFTTLSRDLAAAEISTNYPAVAQDYSVFALVFRFFVNVSDHNKI